MSQSPLVSVVIAAFNEQDHVSKAVESIAKQTFEDLEVIVVDDGSTDGTYDSLKKFHSDQRVRVIQQSNSGLYNALRRGIGEAKGQLIARLDADDWAFPTRIEKQIEFFRSHPDHLWLGTGEHRVDDQRAENTYRKYPAADRDVRRMAAKCIPYCHSSIMFRREVIDMGLNYAKDGSFMSDFVFFQEVARQGMVANLDEVLVRRWLRDESFYQSKFKRSRQNRRLSWLSLKAAWKFGLPLKYYGYPIARLAYPWIPNGLKRTIRSTGGIHDVDSSKLLG